MRKRGVQFSIWGIRVLTAVIAAFLFSCNDPVSRPIGKGLTLSATEKTVGYSETTATLSVVASRDWSLEITGGDNWLNATPTEGTRGTTTVRFTFDRLEGDAPRDGEVTLKAVGERDPYIFTIRQTPASVLSGVNKWILEEMSGWYYWNDAIKTAAQPDNTLAYDEFLSTLIQNLPWSSVQDTSDGESPATIDGAYRSDSYGNPTTPLTRGSIYSRIDRIDPSTRAMRAASESVATTFGFEVTAFNIVDTSGKPLGYLYYLVNWVRPDSPAAKAGLTRGMWIVKYNNAQITMSQHEKFIYQLYLLEGGLQMTLTDEYDRTYDLTAVEMTATPILRHEVITSPGGKKVAYLFYNGFDRGDEKTGASGKFDFEEELRDVFREFKDEGAQELVLDLRYNPGGYVNTCQILTSLAADVDRNKVFAKMKRNAGIVDYVRQKYNGEISISNPQIEHFLNEPNSLKLRKVYVLATASSASASEMVISSLEGEGIEVVHIGTTTNGKNVGMDLLEPTDDRGEKIAIEGYNYELWPITFKILNAKDFCDYAGGFKPDYFIDEFRGKLQNEVMYQLGDPKERLLQAALTLIDGGTLTPDTRGAATTRADGTAMQPLPSFEDPRRGGARYIPTHALTKER
jgi:C-terminal processing protease CtpA/Prc